MTGRTTLSTTGVSFCSLCFLGLLCFTAQSASAENYAVIFAGGVDRSENHSRYYNSTRDIYNALVYKLNYLGTNIIVLASDGLDPADDINGGGSSDWGFVLSSGGSVDSATSANLQAALTGLAGTLDDEDTFFLWTYDHGGGEEGDPTAVVDEYLCGWGGNISDRSLASWVAPINAGRQAYAFGQCMAGGMLEELGITAGSGMFGAASSNYYETSLWNSGENPRGWTDAFYKAIQDHGKTGTHEIEQWAYDHTFSAAGRGPGGTWRDGDQHPWRVGDDFDLGVSHWNALGATSHWSEAANWKAGLLPDDAMRTVRIGSPFPSTVDGGTHDIRTLVLMRGTSLTIDDGAAVDVGYLENKGGLLRIDDGELFTARDCAGTSPDSQINVFSDGQFLAGDLLDFRGGLTVSGGTAETLREFTGAGEVILRSGGTLTVGSSMTLGAGSTLELAGTGTGVDVSRDLAVSGTLEMGLNTSLVVGGVLELGGDGAFAGEVTRAMLDVHEHFRLKRGSLTISRSTVQADWGVWTGTSGDSTIDLLGGTLRTTGLVLGSSEGLRGDLTMASSLAVDPQLIGEGRDMWIMVGQSGSATFTQNAGVVADEWGTSGPSMIIASGLRSDSQYVLNDGTASFDTANVGGSGTGQFTQNGGRVTFQTLVVAGSGEGTCTQNGGEATVAVSLILGEMAAGTGVYHLRGGTLTVHGSEVGDGAGVLNVDGGTLVVAGPSLTVQSLNIGHTAGRDGEFAPGAINLVVETLHVGGDARGTLTAESTDIDVTGALHVGHNHWGGQIDQVGGTVDAPVVYVGTQHAGSGGWEMEGGTLTAAALYLGCEGIGHIIQRGGSTVIVENAYIGYGRDSASNYHRLEDGTMTVADTLKIGVLADGRGQFQVAGADLSTVLTTENTWVGVDGEGELLHTGGLHVVTNFLRVGAGSGSGTYNQQGGQLDTPITYVGVSGQGTFNLTGGVHNTPNLTVGFMAAGTYNLGETGVLNSPAQYVGHSHAGTFNQTGGTNNATGNVHVGYGLSVEGTVDQSGGESIVDGDLYVGSGRNSAGDVTLGGGPTPGATQEVHGDVHLGYATDSTGLYTIDGKVYYVGGGWTYAGALTVHGDVHVGGNGAGRLNINPAGLLTANGRVIIGSETHGGTVQLAGGTIVGSGSVAITHGTGRLTGRGGTTVPVTNDGMVDVGNSNMMLNGGFTQSPIGETRIGASGSLTVDGGGTFEGTLLNRGGLWIRGGTFDLETSLNGGLAPPGEVSVGGTLNVNAAMAASNVSVVFGTLNVAAGVQADSTYVEHGSVVHTAGDFNAGDLTVAEASYDLSGPDTLIAVQTKAFGTFTQSGATHLADALRIGGNERGYDLPGTYTISGGRLEVGVLTVGEAGYVDPLFPEFPMPDIPGTLAITDAAAEVYVTDRLVLTAAATVSIVPGAEIHMTGSMFVNDSTSPAALADLCNLTLIFEGGVGVVDQFEVSGRDVGSDAAGLADNFALGTLRLTGDAGVGQIMLVDACDNQVGWDGSEALYVESLILGPGASLDLNGLNVYYGAASIDAGATVDLNGGQLRAIPEPGSVGILIAGGLLTTVRRRRRRRARCGRSR